MYGYVFSNIRRCVRKNDGDCMTSVEDSSFILSARLNLPANRYGLENRREENT